MSERQAPGVGEWPASVLDHGDPRWRRLHRIIDETSLLRGEFTLTSGRTSSYLFQLRQAMLHPEGSWLVGDILAEFMERHAIACVGGLEMGAVPMVTAAACLSHHRNRPVKAFFIRKQAKDHGARERVNGHVGEGGEVLFIDDVTTTGGSIVRAIEGLAESHDCTVRWAFSILDREEGARENLAEAGIRLVSVFTTSDFAV